MSKWSKINLYDMDDQYDNNTFDWIEFKEWKGISAESTKEVFRLTDVGCGCCSDEYFFTKDQMIEIIDEEIKRLGELKKKLQN